MVEGTFRKTKQKVKGYGMETDSACVKSKEACGAGMEETRGNDRK